MICISLSDQDYSKCLSQIHKIDMAEIRLDLTEFNDQEIEQIFALKKKLIATCRSGIYSDQERSDKLKKAVKAGATFIDIEYESPVAYRKELMAYAHKYQCDVIISYHNFECTPSLRDLEKIMKNCFAMGCDVAKIATMVNVNRDNSKILALYKAPGRLVAIGMGELGKISRIIAPFLGAEFTFASPDNGKATAPGQIKYSQLSNLILNIQKV